MAADGASLPGAEVVVTDGVGVRAVWKALEEGVSLRRTFLGLGEVAVADAGGFARVRVAAEASEVALVGRAPGAFATLHRARIEQDAVSLVFQPRPEVRARVVDAAGAPVAGVEVALWTLEDLGLDDANRSRTDAEGMAYLYPLANRMGLTSPGAVRCSIVGVFAEPIEAHLEPLALPTQPVELRLPPHGYVRVQAGGASRPALLHANALLRLTARPEIADGAPEHPAPGLPSATFGGAELLLGPVALGLTVEVRGKDPYSHARWVARGAGPTAAGEVVPLTLERRAGVRLLGRAVGAEGEPLAHARLRAALIPPRVWGRREETSILQCGEDGRFVWELPEELDSDVELVLRTERPGARLMAHVERPSAHEGDIELGDVPFPPLPLLVSGRLLDERGEPVAGARIRVQRRMRVGTIDPTGQEFTAERVVSDAAGHFEARGELAPVELRVVVSREGFVEAAREITRGADVGDWLLQRVARISGRLLLDPNVPIDRLRVAVGGQTRSVGPDGSFRIEALPPGEHAVVLGARDWVGPPVTLWPAARVESSATLELGVRDLTGELALTRLHIRGHDGARLDRCELEWWPDDPPLPAEVAESMLAWTGRDRVSESSYLSRSGPDGAFDLLHVARGVSGRLQADGHRPLPVELAGLPMEVELRPALAVAVRVLDAHTLPEGSRLSLVLQDMSATAPAENEWVENGVAHLSPAHPGPWRARLIAMGVSNDLTTPAPTIEVADSVELQSFEISVPDAVRRALERQRDAR